MKLSSLNQISPTVFLLGSLPCPDCNTTITVSVQKQTVDKYMQGGLVHEVLADYEPKIRERFVSGYCGECWDKMFGIFEEGLEDVTDLE